MEKGHRTTSKISNDPLAPVTSLVLRLSCQLLMINQIASAFDQREGNKNKDCASFGMLQTVTRNKSKWQYKWRVCTDETIQRRESVGLREHNNDKWKRNDGEGCQMDLQKGAGRQKFQLGCVFSESNHSSPRVRDLHLAVSLLRTSYYCNENFELWD